MRRKKMNSNLSKRFRVLAMSLALIGTMLVGPMSNTADASADGCTPAPYGSVCIYVTGKGLNVKKISVARSKIDLSLICHYAGEVEIRPPKGRKYSLPVQSQNNCAVGRAWFNWYGNWNFPHGTRIFVHFYEDGKKVGGSPAITVLEKDWLSRAASHFPKIKFPKIKLGW
jgi:hypothetical protein